MCLKDHIVLFCKIRVDTIYNIMYTRSYYRKESAASPQENKGSMHNLLNKRLFIWPRFARTRWLALFSTQQTTLSIF
jgi:hypothetical protein